MSQVIGNPAEIRAFAAQLKKFGNELQNGFASTKGKLGQLGNTWKDQEHAKFLEQFQQSTQPVQKLIQDMDAYTAFLLRKAQRLEEYENQR